MEDVDFRQQLLAKNIAFLFLPKASVIHPWKSLIPDDAYLKMRLISEAIFFDRYPLLRPSFLDTCRIILRGWVWGSFKEAPRLKFRGFWRCFARQSTASRCQFLIWSGLSRKQARAPARRQPPN
jgi:hypothetical protein